MYGSPEGLVTSGVTVIESPDPSARFGWIHATTTSDSALLIGAPGYDHGAATDAGAVYFYPLTSPGLGSASRVTQSSPGVDGDSTAGDNFGGVVAEDLVGMPNKNVGAAADAGAAVKLVTTTGDPMTVRGMSYTQNSPACPAWPRRATTPVPPWLWTTTRPSGCLAKVSALRGTPARCRCFATPTKNFK